MSEAHICLTFEVNDANLVA